jgi:hypothetical protein
MEEKHKHKRFTDGTSQADRFPKALGEGYIKVDEMRFEDLLALGADYAGILKFFNLSNQTDRSWAPFFTADALVIFAKILAIDLEKIGSAFLDVFLNTFDPDDYDLTAVPNYQLAHEIDFWLKRLKTIESEAGQKLLLVIEGVIEDKLRKQLHALEHFLDQSFIESDFDRIWSIPQTDERPSGHDTPTRKDQSDDEHFLRSNFAAFYNAVSLIRESIRKLLPQALGSQIHNPAIGMYVAFIKLYQKVQQKLNRFTAKHLDFYYRDVLKIQPRKLIPDRAFLKFDTDVAGREVFIKAGTEFTAGTDETNTDVIYTADNDLLVYSTRVESLYTLFLERDQLTSPERDLEFVTGAKINRIDVLKENDVANDQESKAWPIFGAPRSASQKRVFEDAGLGFAIASPVLFLTEGQREIYIKLKTGPAVSESSQCLGDFISDVIKIIRENKQQVKDKKLESSSQKSSRADIFFKVFRRMFTIQLTAENGWYEVEDYLPLSKVVDDQCGEDCLNIRIKLSPKDQAIVPYASEIHGGGYDTDQPIIRFVINPMAYLCPYTLLKDIVIKEIEIDVDVKGVKDVVLHNNLGQLDPNSPFNPFGPLPVIGSYFIIGNQEAACKQLTHFEVEVDWAGLPFEKGGFKDYYRAYETDCDNDVFEAGLTVLNGGKWQPAIEIDRPRVKLFESGAEGIAKNRRLSCQGVVKLFRPLEERRAPDEFGYDSSKKDGFFKFTLAAPNEAFGHGDYFHKLTKVLTENAKLKKLRLHKPIPNPPYTPQIDNMSINYRANVRVNLEKIGASEKSRPRGRIYHIHPFGVERLSPQTDAEITMVPRYDSDGNLFIGLSPRVLSGTLTLLFHLRNDSSLKSDADPPALKWYYLSSNRWKRLEGRHVLIDTTKGFLSSGIVTLHIPAQERGTSTTMPGDLFWLRVSLDHQPEIPCSVFSINTQALEVTWQKQDDSSAHMDLRLPAGTIKDSRVSIAGIDRIVQIADSFGGRLPEEEDPFKTRVSERLRHKNRATVPWDFERLILNHFPEIYKVKCFANMVDDPQSLERPGHILIVVIPVLKDSSAANLTPTVNGMLLKEIGEYVKGLSSPFGTFKVRNPAYEKIQVRCKVQFRRGKAGGYYIKELNQALVNYLSPWNKTGYTTRFGWCVRRYDLKSYIRNLDYINFVTDFSMLRVAEDDNGYYSLFDTVARQVKEITPLFPWSIAIPFKQHYIEVSEEAEVIKPAVTGINELEIGSNFIIPGKQSHASEK